MPMVSIATVRSAVQNCRLIWKSYIDYFFCVNYNISKQIARLLSAQNPSASCIYAVSLFYLHWLSVLSSYKMAIRASRCSQVRDETTNQLRENCDFCLFLAVDQRQQHNTVDAVTLDASAYCIC